VKRSMIAFVILFFLGQTVCVSEGKRVNLSYLYFGSPSTYVSQMDKTQNTLTMVSPNYFDIIDQGALDVTWKLDTAFISEMHRRGIRVVPFLSNHWNKDFGIAAVTTNAEQLTTDIAAAVAQYQMDGVNVDIEGVNHLYRDQFTNFVKLLRAKIPADKEVSVAVAANPNNWTTGWHGFYDYKALGATADYLFIMSYDESWEGSETVAPVSSIAFFERSLTYALNQGLPKEKVVMGIPFYGRIWKLNGPTLEGLNIAGVGVSNTRVAPMLAQFGGRPNFDASKQSARSKFTIPVGEYIYIAAKKLTEGDYYLWYDNEQAIKAKLKMISAYGIKGAGSWSLYQDTADTWDYFTSWLNGTFFSDVKNNYWAENAILDVSEKGWLTGVSPTSFAPESALTRAQGAVILVRALNLNQAANNTAPFSDIKGHWAESYIQTAFSNAIVEGMAPNHFEPEEPLTREQLSVMLARIFNLNAQAGETPFTDVTTDRWSHSAVLAMYQNGFIQGLTNDKFGVTEKTTRAQMATLMMRLTPNIEKKVAEPAA
jgi:spore germination protein YaaH